MPPRKKAPAGPPPLTDADVSALRDRVKAGDKPRVLVRAASAAVPAGTRGNVVRIGNPSEGEYIVVRLGRDEVPFAPNELAMTTRTKSAVAATSSAPTRKASARTSTGRPTVEPVSRPTKTAEPTRRTTKAAEPRPAAAATRPSTRRRVTRGRTRASGQRTPPPLTVTLRFADGDWSVEAARGARRLSKPTALRPGAVKAFAELVDEPQVRDALTETVESCRAVVEERAAALRAQLQDAEAALKEYEARRR